jgi:hypothetical protein
MGYTGLSGPRDSDAAADLLSVIENKICKLLRKELKRNESCSSYNTGSVVNVALILELLGPALEDSCDDDMMDLFETTIDELQQIITKTEKEAWTDASAKMFHLKAYRRMLRRLKKYHEFQGWS